MDQTFDEMSFEELLKIVKNSAEFHKRLMRIMRTSAPTDWPTANWIYEELTKAIYDEDIWEKN